MTRHIVDLILELDKKDELIISIPKGFTESEIIDVIKKTSDISKDDIVVEDVIEDEGKTHYKITICDVIDYIFTLDDDETITYSQLQIKAKGE